MKTSSAIETIRAFAVDEANASDIGALLSLSRGEAAEIVAGFDRARREADVANAARSAFLALMSHEIRTPLNGVLGMSQAMEADALEPRQRERLTAVRQSGQALLSVLNDLLDVAKIEAGALALDDAEFDLAQVVEDACAAFAAPARQKGVGLWVEVEGVRGLYHGDPARIGQILNNLLSNAVKFTAEGEIRVVAEAVAGGVRLTVSDTGVGMVPEAAAQLFERFYQADASTTRRFGGAGLGLAICRELAALMGGRIEVESRLGQGSTMTVTAPLRRAGPRAAGPASPGQARAPRVLVAEDHKVNRMVIEAFLGQIGVKPEMVENGADAVAAWETGAFDVILMDVQMPVLDGVAATRAIRRMEAERRLPRTPIIALTANVLHDQLKGYEAAGMDTHVPKPIDARALFERLQTLLYGPPSDARLVA